MPEPIFSSEGGDLTVLPTWGAGAGAIVSIRFPVNSQQQIIAANAQGALAQPLTLDECRRLGTALFRLWISTEETATIACAVCGGTGLVFGGINWYPCHSCEAFRERLADIALRSDGPGGEATRALEDTNSSVGARTVNRSHGVQT